MDQAVKDSLDYYTKNFSPYQHHQVRILEFPRYQPFAQSFPNTIPFSEGIGFIAKVDRKDPEGPRLSVLRDGPRGRAPVVGAPGDRRLRAGRDDAVGDARAVFGADGDEAQVRRREDEALPQVRARQLPALGRGVERKKELPLYRNENQGYIHYRKGSLAMYELQDAIGEDNVNRALASYIKKVAFQEPAVHDLARAAGRVPRGDAPGVPVPDHRPLRVHHALREPRDRGARAKEVGRGAWEVTLKVEAKKLQADETGAQNEVPDGRLGGHRRARRGRQAALPREAPHPQRRIDVHRARDRGKPVKAGIDPVNKLIDRSPTTTW